MIYDDDKRHAHVQREKEAARKMRRSRWWQNLIANKAKCYYCLQELQLEQTTMDHILPVSRGGRSTKGNVVIACKPCNTEKRNLTPSEWLAYLEGKIKP